ncbi:MAG: CAP domain-containing protein [Nitrososphaerales archaeon]
MEAPKKQSWSVFTAVLAVIIIVALLLLFVPGLSLGNILSPKQSTSTFVQNPSGNSVNTTASNITITYPSNYDTLLNYTLSIINQNRTSFGLSPVTTSPIPSGQQHADSMLQNNYFSHWDTQGFKPYMRYSLLNGTGFVEENIAYEYSGFTSFISTQSVEKAIGSLEWQMMNNDSACCANGHRDNILNQYHNRVSIGIAYSSTYVYFVEDFETYFTELNTPVAQGNSIILEGNTSQTLNPTSVDIYYDPTPTAVTPSTLNSVYNTPYDQGSFVGGVLAPCDNIFRQCQKFSQGITVGASTWQVGSGAINIQFSLANFIQVDGPGVYTIYLVQGSSNNTEFLTSISVFITS